MFKLSMRVVNEVRDTYQMHSCKEFLKSKVKDKCIFTRQSQFTIDIVTATGCWLEHQSNPLIRLYGIRSRNFKENLVFQQFYEGRESDVD